jgi:hypothetical protein
MAVSRPALGIVMAAVCAALAATSPAGNLEPARPPGPTMKTLGEIPPTWSQSLDSSNGEPDGCNSTRFTCVMGGVAVLDNETGLVWDREPDPDSVGSLWIDARVRCADKSLGSRGGWRVPSLPELTSLLIGLGPDTPFQYDPSQRYWTITSVANNPLSAWAVRGSGNSRSGRFGKMQALHVWCVRGAGVPTEY